MTGDFMYGVSEPISRSREGIDDFKFLRERIFEVIEKMLDLGLQDRDSCLEMKGKLETNTFNLVVVGQFKRGKTCLINALLGADILPVSVLPLTSIVTIVVYSETVAVKVFFKNGKKVDIPVESLSDYVTETGNPKNDKEVSEVAVLYPSPYLKDGVRLVDTPGVGSVYIHNTDVAYRYLPKSDAALFLLSIDQPVSSAELEFLNDVREYAGRIFFLLNKTDYLSAGEVGSALLFAKETLEQIMGPDIRIFPISAKLGLQAKLNGSLEDLAASGLPVFSETLDRFLVKEKGKVLLESVSKNLQKVLSRARLETELELKSLGTPVEEIRQKIAAFEDRKAELIQERLSFDALFSAETERLIIRELDRGIADLKGRLVSEMEEEFNLFYESKKDLSLKELNDALEKFVLDKIQEEFTAWREVEDERLSNSFDSICGRFASKVNGVTDSLLDFSCRLFSVPFEAVEAESLRSSESSFHYKLRGDAVGLDMLTDSLTLVVPGYISGKWKFRRLRDWAVRTANKMILGKRKRHMLEMIEMQAGRLRSDFLDRLNRSASGFRTRIIGNMDTIAGGIARAIESGVDLRLRGEEEAARKQSRLAERLSAMELIRGELARIREGIEKI
ncbi:MAG: dynamin family protein [Syntrophobacteraceae bacterium]